MKRTLSFILSALLIPGFALVAHAADAQLEAGKKAYNARQYRAALNCFRQVVQRDAMVFLYEANCCYALGQMSSAAQLAQYITQHFAGRPEASAAEGLLTRIGRGPANPGGPGASALPGPAGTPAAVQTPSAHNNQRPTTSGSAPNLNTLIYTVPGAVQVGNVSAGFLREVKSHLGSIPSSLLGELQSRGARICVTPRLADKFPDFRNTRPRGWEEGYTGKNVDGLFDGSDVIVCEYSASIEDDNFLEKNHRSGYIVRHELGHAFDRYWNNLSDTEEYKHQYLLELAKVDSGSRDDELAYFCQKSDAGRSECFAELFAIMMGGASSKKVTDGLSAYFPNTMKLIRKRLGF